jgi:hypothetical protein
VSVGGDSESGLIYVRAPMKQSNGTRTVHGRAGSAGSLIISRDELQVVHHVSEPAGRNQKHKAGQGMESILHWEMNRETIILHSTDRGSGDCDNFSIVNDLMMR